jgi:hypothetical protein
MSAKMKAKIHVGKAAARPKGLRIRVGGRPGSSGRVVYERTTCCWSIRQSESQIRR